MLVEKRKKVKIAIISEYELRLSDINIIVKIKEKKAIFAVLDPLRSKSQMTGTKNRNNMIEVSKLFKIQKDECQIS